MDIPLNTASPNDIVNLLHRIETLLKLDDLETAHGTALILDDLVHSPSSFTVESEERLHYSNLVTSLWVELEHICKHIPHAPSEKELASRVVYLQKVIVEMVALSGKIGPL